MRREFVEYGCDDLIGGVLGYGVRRYEDVLFGGVVERRLRSGHYEADGGHVAKGRVMLDGYSRWVGDARGYGSELLLKRGLGDGWGRGRG